ncbi:DUF3828 domain-containing protein [Brevundimonas subvibrioides]|uniref:DUF3828 domain-containing protein n=1 Tax=Brevundimonas subvibrioides TaxID=74313 RepID=UPI0022B3C05A|nr:DUF3828 domain-containing protein [Brevundimonas subvibrioides]
MRVQSSALVALTALGLSLAACDQGVAEPASAGASAPAAASGQGADTAGAEAFVRALFAAYGDTPGSTGPEDPWSAGTQALLDADGEEAGGIGYLEADPICDCQDWDRLRVTSLAVASTGADSADAVVAFAMGDDGKITHETLKLVREGKAWKVDDIVYGEGHSMVGEPPLKQGVAASTAAMLAEDARGQ